MRRECQHGDVLVWGKVQTDGGEQLLLKQRAVERATRVDCEMVSPDSTARSNACLPYNKVHEACMKGKTRAFWWSGELDPGK